MTKSIGHLIPMELVNKITLMSYGLNPHPNAMSIKNISKELEIINSRLDYLIENSYGVRQDTNKKEYGLTKISNLLKRKSKLQFFLNIDSSLDHYDKLNLVGEMLAETYGEYDYYSFEIGREYIDMINIQGFEISDLMILFDKLFNCKNGRIEDEDSDY